MNSEGAYFRRVPPAPHFQTGAEEKEQERTEETKKLFGILCFLCCLLLVLLIRLKGVSL
jgi:hypothetical protein